MANYIWTPDPADVGSPPAEFTVLGVAASGDMQVIDGGGGEYYLRIAALGTGRRGYQLTEAAGVAIPSAANIDVLVEWQYQTSGTNTSSDGCSLRVFGRQTGNPNSGGDMFLGGVEAQVDTHNAARILGGTFTGLSSTAFGRVANVATRLLTRFRVNGDAITVKTWVEASDEGTAIVSSATNSGIPAAGGVGLFTIARGETRTYRIAVATDGDIATFTPSSTPVAFTGTVPTLNGTESVAFSESLASYFSGTETPFTYAIHAGTLPAGLTLNTSTGVISGTPTTAGTSAGIVIRVTDATPNTADTNSFSIVIAAPATVVSFTGTVPAQSWVEDAAITPLDLSSYFSGSLTPFTYAVTTGTLPAGLSINTSTGVISGTPTTPATAVSIVVTATDTGTNTAATNAFDVTITAAPAANTVTVTEPLKNNTGTLHASASGIRVAVLRASDFVQVHEDVGLTTNASGILSAITDVAIVAATSYHVVIKLADGSVGVTGPIVAS